MTSPARNFNGITDIHYTLGYMIDILCFLKIGIAVDQASGQHKQDQCGRYPHIFHISPQLSTETDRSECNDRCHRQKPQNPVINFSIRQSGYDLRNQRIEEDQQQYQRYIDKQDADMFSLLCHPQI